MNNWLFLIPTVPAAVSAVVAVLVLLRQGARPWSVSDEPTNGYFGDVVVTYQGHRAITDVVVTLRPRPHEYGTTTRERVDPGGKVRVEWLIGEEHESPETVMVTWRGRFGRQRNWESAL